MTATNPLGIRLSGVRSICISDPRLVEYENDSWYDGLITVVMDNGQTIELPYSSPHEHDGRKPSKPGLQYSRASDAVESLRWEAERAKAAAAEAIRVLEKVVKTA